ncbi:hypothetical protein R3P38DRAFT_3046787 [Favolaschia claudopus]|uniref:Uncharacterized protein n=1 Tax=Favolaschia claudopus TaxID=2862362 RepID=A0AAW0A5X6_9AGAR
MGLPPTSHLPPFALSYYQQLILFKLLFNLTSKPFTSLSFPSIRRFRPSTRASALFGLHPFLPLSLTLMSLYTSLWFIPFSSGSPPH